MNLDKCFVSFSTNDNYLKLSEIMIESVSKFSKYPIILYCIDFDEPYFKHKFSNVFYKKIDKQNRNIFLFKSLVIKDAIENMNVKNGIYIESDDIVTPTIDNLFDECNNISIYPLSPIHPGEPNNQDNIMELLQVTNKSMHYVHAHIVFTNLTIDFINEWYNYCCKYINVARNYDETILNVMYWKHNVTKCIDYIYDPYYTTVYNDNFDKNKVFMFHGCKNILEAKKVLNEIEKKYQ